MPFTEKRLAGPTQLTTSASAIYTVPANKTTIVKQIIATNTSASAATFTLYIGAASAGNAIFSATTVLANDSLVINTSQVLSTGEVLRALASANTAINLTISGVENDGPLTPNATYIADNAVTQPKLASNLTGATIVTSSTRATLIPSPFTGQICYETDTGYLRVWNGSAWDYLSLKQTAPNYGTYTDYSASQTFSGFTKGNATVVSRYTQIGKHVHFWGYVTLGSTSSMTGPLDVNLPVTSVGGILTQNSPCSFYNGSVLYWGTTLMISTGALRLVLMNASGTYAVNTDITATVPFTWSTTPTNNNFYWNHVYEAA